MTLGASHELAEMLGVSRQRVHQLATEPSFPAPIAHLKCGRIWDLLQVAQWHAAWVLRRGTYVVDVNFVHPPSPNVERGYN